LVSRIVGWPVRRELEEVIARRFNFSTSRLPPQQLKLEKTQIVVLANSEVADKLGVAFLPSIPLFASVAGAGGGFLGLLSRASGASA